MSFIQQIFGMATAGNPNDERYWSTAMPMSATGIPVSAENALKLSTVWACKRLISESIAALPKIVFERLADGGRERATNHPLYYVLHDQPNSNQTSFEFFDMMTGHALMSGNAYAEIKAGPRGFVDQLIPIEPRYVAPVELPSGNLRYMVHEPRKEPRMLMDDEMLHMKGPSTDGKTGLGVIAHARETIGLALASERYGAKFFANDSRPGGVLKHKGVLKDSAAQRLRDSWRAAHAGGNAHSVAILEEGIEWEAIGLNNRDSQFLETREFQAEDVCRWFGVPPHMVGLTSKATSWGSGIEQMGIGFVTYTLMPWMVRWQQAISRDLIIARQKYFVEFVVDALLRGDTQARFNAYQIARTNGWMSVNEIRQRENMNPIESGDEYLRPLNMTPAGAPANDGGAANAQGPNPHYAALVRETAARVLRKEVAAVERARKRENFSQAVAEFYAEHAEFVAQTLQLPIDRARVWCAEQLAAVETGGDNANGWEATRTVALTELVLEQLHQKAV